MIFSLSFFPNVFKASFIENEVKDVNNKFIWIASLLFRAYSVYLNNASQFSQIKFSVIQSKTFSVGHV